MTFFEYALPFFTKIHMEHSVEGDLRLFCSVYEDGHREHIL